MTPTSLQARAVEVVAALMHAATTAANDDFTRPMTPERERHTARCNAMLSAAALITELAGALPEWRPISTRPDADDEMWFGKFDGTWAFVVDGPRGSSFDDADWWDFWAPCEAPSLPPVPLREKEKG